MTVELFADISQKDKNKVMDMAMLINPAVYTTPANYYCRENPDGSTMTVEIGAVKLGDCLLMRLRVNDAHNPVKIKGRQ